ncbi:MAG: VWA domain-containing protein [Akkermansiaceae bacterium]|jgi:Ca-activated chloride channel family protein|nr:VWA domain-containing protein [Akkermansiaceae bacterium]
MNFAQPAWLILLVLLPLLGVGALAMARMRKKHWADFVSPRLRSALLKRGSSLPRWFALLFLLSACAAMIAGMARPRAEAGTRTEKTLGRNVLIALDLSRSMRVQDVKPDRLSQAKMVIYEILESMPNERMGLIGFAGSAYVYAPLTVDHAAVRQTVEQIDETWSTLGGSDLSAALKLAVDTLKKTGQKNNALVILSDGEKHDENLEDMIEEVRQAGVYILAIGVGTEDGDYVPNKDFPGGRMIDRQGKPVLSRLQADVMRSLAVETKGRYAVAGSGVDIPGIVKATIKDLDAFEVEGRERTVSVEFYQWLLLPAIVFLLGSIIAATRWKGVNPNPAATTALVLLGMVLAMSSPARADAVSDAREAIEKKDWTKARLLYRKLAEDSKLEDRRARFRLGEATAAYQGGDFKLATRSYSKVLMSDEPEVRAQGSIGMGNSLFQLGWKKIAGDAYPANSKDAPSMGDFETKVKELLAKSLEEGQDGPFSLFEPVIKNWTDAVRHFDSARLVDPSTQKASANRETTMIYLKRLQELLQEEKEDTEQSLPQSSPGEGEPREGEEGSGEESENEGGEGKEPDGKEGKNGEKEQENQEGGGGEEKKEPNDGKKPENDQKGKSPDGENPDETPQDRARRILKENADLEKGPLSPGRVEFRDPEKDW